MKATIQGKVIGWKEVADKLLIENNVLKQEYDKLYKHYTDMKDAYEEDLADCSEKIAKMTTEIKKLKAKGKLSDITGEREDAK